MKFNFAKIVLASALSCAALSACVVAPAPVYGEVAYQEPPPVQYEAVGIAPAPGFFWIGGAWFWEGGRYAWHPGHWERSRPGYRWAPHSWRRYGGGWRASPGHWERSR